MTERPMDHCDLLCLDLPHAEAIRAALPDLRSVEPAASAARALGDPTRLTLAAALHRADATHGGDELCVCDLAWVAGVAQNLVSHHLRQLRTAGLVDSRRDGRLVMYRLTERGRALTAAVLAADHV